MADTADALHHAHTRGIVHRDVKPSNILLDEQDRPHLSDFGLAKMDDHYFRNDRGTVLGSVAYMNPEQASGKSEWATPQSDIYSLGVVLYELLCRQRPFKAKDLMERLAEIERRIPPPPRTIDDRIPKALEAVCLKAMQKDPAARYTTAADLAADLRAAVAAQRPRMTAARFSAILGAASHAVLLVALAADQILWGPGGPPLPGTAPEPGGAARQSPAAKPGAPELVFKVQRSDEDGIHHILKDELRYMDKFWITVDLGEVPRYPYMWLYNADGIPVDSHGKVNGRLWPPEGADLTRQQKQQTVNWPNPDNPKECRRADDDTGPLMVLVGVTDQPLSAARYRAVPAVTSVPEG